IWPAARGIRSLAFFSHLDFSDGVRNEESLGSPHAVGEGLAPSRLRRLLPRSRNSQSDLLRSVPGIPPHLLVAVGRLPPFPRGRTGFRGPCRSLSPGGRAKG